MREVLQDDPAPTDKVSEDEEDPEGGGARWGSDEIDGLPPSSRDEHWRSESSSGRASLEIPSARTSMEAFSRPSLDSIMRSDAPNGKRAPPCFASLSCSPLAILQVVLEPTAGA